MNYYVHGVYMCRNCDILFKVERLFSGEWPNSIGAAYTFYLYHTHDCCPGSDDSYGLADLTIIVKGGHVDD